MVFIYEYELLFLSKQVVSFFLMCSIATGRMNKSLNLSISKNFRLAILK